MASYGLLKGLGGGLQQAAHDLGQQLRDERMQQYKMDLQQKIWDRQDVVRAEDRLYDEQKTADDRAYQEGLLKRQWAREDSKEAAQLESQAAYTDTATQDGKQYKVFFNKAGQEMGRVELGDATASTQRTYLDPMVAARLKSLDSEINALQRKDLLEEEDQDRLRQLIAERDRIQLGQSPEAATQPPMPGARQAPDGNWYVLKDGKYYRVD